MAWRFRQLYVESGDILDADHWVTNMHEMAEEFNGYLDQDNFRLATIDEDSLREKSCNQYFQVTSTTDWEPDVATMKWQGRDSILNKDFTLAEDASIRISAGLGFAWDGSPPTDPIPDHIIIEFRLIIDGNVVDQTGGLSSARRWDCVHMVAGMPLEAGAHEAWVECRVYVLPDPRDPYHRETLMKISATDTSTGTQLDVNLRARELDIKARYR